MADQTTPALGRPGKTLPQLVMATTAKTYEITYPATGGRPINRGVSFVCDSDWFIAEPANTDFVPVAATQPYEVICDRGTVTVYVKSASGTPTLCPFISI